MENDRFDAVVRAWTSGTPRRLVLGLLAGSLVGLASDDEREAAAKKKKKVTLCLNGQTITAKKNKQATLLGQGATRGACAVSPPPPPPRPSPPPPPPSPPVVDTCTDGVLNGFETDVDCGGSCSARCRVNRQCSRDFDCTTSRCDNGQCVACEGDVTCPDNCRCGALAMCFNPTNSVIRDGPDCSRACPPRTGSCELAGAATRFRCFPYCGEIYPV